MATNTHTRDTQSVIAYIYKHSYMQRGVDTSTHKNYMWAVLFHKNKHFPKPHVAV